MSGVSGVSYHERHGERVKNFVLMYNYKDSNSPLLKHMRTDGEDVFILGAFPLYCLPKIIKGVSDGSVGKGIKGVITITILKIIKQYQSNVPL